MSTSKERCPHRVIRRSKEQSILEGMEYVCGSCAKRFSVKTIEPPPPVREEPMFPKNPIPWGLRPRQA